MWDVGQLAGAGELSDDALQAWVGRRYRARTILGMPELALEMHEQLTRRGVMLHDIKYDARGVVSTYTLPSGVGGYQETAESGFAVWESADARVIKDYVRERFIARRDPRGGRDEATRAQYTEQLEKLGVRLVDAMDAAVDAPVFILPTGEVGRQDHVAKILARDGAGYGPQQRAKLLNMIASRFAVRNDRRRGKARYVDSDRMRDELVAQGVHIDDRPEQCSYTLPNGEHGRQDRLAPPCDEPGTVVWDTGELSGTAALDEAVLKYWVQRRHRALTSLSDIKGMGEAAAELAWYLTRYGVTLSGEGAAGTFTLPSGERGWQGFVCYESCPNALDGFDFWQSDEAREIKACIAKRYETRDPRESDRLSQRLTALGVVRMGWKNGEPPGFVLKGGETGRQDIIHKLTLGKDARLDAAYTKEKRNELLRRIAVRCKTLLDGSRGLDRFKECDSLGDALAAEGVTLDEHMNTFTLPNGEHGQQEHLLPPPDKQAEGSKPPHDETAALKRMIGQRYVLRFRKMFFIADVVRDEAVARGVKLDDNKKTYMLPSGEAGHYNDVLKQDRHTLHSPEELIGYINARAHMRAAARPGWQQQSEALRNYLCDYGVQLVDASNTYTLPNGETGQYDPKPWGGRDRAAARERPASGAAMLRAAADKPKLKPASAFRAVADPPPPEALASLKYSQPAADRLARERFAHEGDAELVQVMDAQLAAWDVSLDVDGGYWSHPDGTLRYEGDFAIPLPPLKPRVWYTGGAAPPSGSAAAAAAAGSQISQILPVKQEDVIHVINNESPPPPPPPTLAVQDIQDAMRAIADLRERRLEADAQRKRGELEAQGVAFDDAAFTWRTASGQEGAQVAGIVDKILTLWRHMQALRAQGKEAKAKKAVPYLQERGCSVKEAEGVWVTRDGRSGPLGELSASGIRTCFGELQGCAGRGDAPGAAYWNEYLSAYGVSFDAAAGTWSRGEETGAIEGASHKRPADDDAEPVKRPRMMVP